MRDETHHRMLRLRYPGGELSALMNLVRAKHALACYRETYGRAHGARRDVFQGRIDTALCVRGTARGANGTGQQ